MSRITKFEQEIKRNAESNRRRANIMQIEEKLAEARSLYAVIPANGTYQEGLERNFMGNHIRELEDMLKDEQLALKEANYAHIE